MRIRKIILVFLGAIFLTSCSNSGKKSISFVLEDDKICGLDLLADTNEVLNKVMKWQEECKFKITKSSNSLGQLIEFSLPISNEDNLSVRFDFLKGKLIRLKINSFIQIDNGFEDYKNKLNEFLNKHYKLISDNQSLWNIGQPDYNIRLNESSGELEMYIDLHAKVASDLIEMNKSITSLNPRKFVLDFRDGEVIVPEGKLWIINKCRRMLGSSMDSTKIFSDNILKCGNHVVNDRTKRYDIAINGACKDISGSLVWSDNGSANNTMKSEGYYNDPNTIEIIDIGNNFEFRFLPSGTAFGINTPPTFSPNVYMSISYFEISEYEMSQVKNASALNNFIKSLGLIPSDYYFTKLYNNIN